jgi:hypothetical protein
MAKKLLVRQPKTTDGITIAYDDKQQPIYKEAIVEPWAKKQFESLNGSLPPHLRYTFQEIEVDEEAQHAQNFNMVPAPAEDDLIGDDKPMTRPGGRRYGQR